MSEWGGRRAIQARTIVATWLPSPCGQCQVEIMPGEPFNVGHIVARSIRPDLTWVLTNWRPEHPACSDKSAQAVVIAKSKAEALSEAGFFPNEDTPGSPRSFPSLSPGALQGIEAVREDLAWPVATMDAPPWLVPYLDVPGDVATPPLAMTPPHPEATGSYGPALIEWARRTQNINVRWWQGLSLVRILEHREDGSLCWEEVLLSASRRSGKSVIVRLLALWRLMFAPGLFGEEQLIVQSASTLKVAKEPMRYAGRWARAHPKLKVSTNNNNYSIEHDDGHRWIVVPPDSTAGLDTCLGLLDEAWAIKPEVVDDDLEPTLLERVSPQLLMVSTAHRRATSLMRGRLAGALESEDGRTLLLLWAAPANMDLADPATWRAASPHWTEQRRSYIAAKYTKALAGEDDLEFDDANPMLGWRSQFMNVWPLRETVARGNTVIEAEGWQALTALPDTERAPQSAAIEDWYDGGVSLALAWREGDGAVVSVTDHLDLASAVATLKETGYRRKVIVGKSLSEDPALTTVAVIATVQRGGPAVEDLDRLIKAGAFHHDGGAHLTDQLLAVRTKPSPEGIQVITRERADAVKAAVWAANAARQGPAEFMGMVLPKGA